VAENQEAREQGGNPMTKPTLDKVTVHISVGEGGQKLINAENIDSYRTSNCANVS